jgi:hypothetical protein
MTLVASLIEQAERFLPQLVLDARANGHTWREIATPSTPDPTKHDCASTPTHPSPIAACPTTVDRNRGPVGRTLAQVTEILGAMTDVDVSGWRPTWEPAETHLRTHAERLRSLRGRRVTDAWIVWNLEVDEWFADLPVVVQFEDGLHLEVCWQKFDDLSITWNTIDVAVTPHAWVTWPLEWRSQGHPALSKIIDDPIIQVEATEHLFTTRTVDQSYDIHSVWLISGIWLRTAQTGLHIFNALDENGLSSEPPLTSPELRHFPI